jgi:tetratricopeptide (TPR) repeat protein
VAARRRASPIVLVAALLTATLPAPAVEARHKKHRRPHAGEAATPPRASQVDRRAVVNDVAPDRAAARPAARALLALPPEAARAYQASYDHEAAGRFADALRDLGELPAPERDSYFGRLRHGWLLYRAGRHADAVAAYRQAIALEKGSVEARVGGLLPLIALRRWPEVEEGARAAIELDPANYLAGLRLAFAVYNRGRYAEAETLYRGVLSRYPGDAEARSGLGWSLLKQGKRPEARQAFLAASRAAPRSPTVVDGLGAVDR